MSHLVSRAGAAYLATCGAYAWLCARFTVQLRRHGRSTSTPRSGIDSKASAASGRHDNVGTTTKDEEAAV